MMRIITGSAKGTKLETLEGEATRPTTERVKEAIFSAIHFDLEGCRVLDLFAGSGQMGLEAMSRGADSCMFVDASGDAMAIVKANAKKTGMFDRSGFLISDYRNYLRKAGGKDAFGIIFLDPPYAMHCVEDALRRIVEEALAKPGCILVCESGDAELFTDPKLAARFTVKKSARYSRSYVHILLYRGEDA